MAPGTSKQKGSDEHVTMDVETICVGQLLHCDWQEREIEVPFTIMSWWRGERCEVGLTGKQFESTPTMPLCRWRLTLAQDLLHATFQHAGLSVHFFRLKRLLAQPRHQPWTSHKDHPEPHLIPGRTARACGLRTASCFILRLRSRLYFGTTLYDADDGFVFCLTSLWTCIPHTDSSGLFVYFSLHFWSHLDLTCGFCGLSGCCEQPLVAAARLLEQDTGFQKD